MNKRSSQPKSALTRETTSLPALLNEAFLQHRAGRLAEAERLYRQILAINPRHADALHLCGIVANQTGRYDVAVDLIGKAIAVDGAVAPYHGNLGNALRSLGRHDDAIAAYNAAIRIQPDVAQLHCNLGAALNDAGRSDDAMAAYHTAIRIQPDFAAAHSNLGNVLQALGRLDEAVTAYHTAIRIAPDFAEAYSNLGNVLKDLKRFTEAIDACGIAIRIKPDFAQAHCNLGISLQSLDRLDEALAAYDAAIRIRPDYAKAFGNKVNALMNLGRFDEAFAACEAATASVGPGMHIPDLPEVHYGESLLRLLHGDLTAGWQKYEWRWRRNGKGAVKARSFAQPRWDGQDLAGHTVLLYAEQGLGDTIQFCRYAALVAARGGRVILEAPRHLLRLLSGLKGVDQLLAAGQPLPAFDLQCPLMSLPGAFATTLETIPGATPYLDVEDEARERWGRQLGSSGFKVGIVWQGNPLAPAELGRSAPLACFAPLANIPGVRLISLQKNHGLEQLEQIPPGMRVETLGANFDAVPDAFVDTAAVMMNLDLIITVDTAIGHLAGALGRPVWLALQKVPHWVWMLNRSDSPWYPSARLFRQTGRGNWADVFLRMAEALRESIEEPRRMRNEGKNGVDGQHSASEKEGNGDLSLTCAAKFGRTGEAMPLMVEISPGELLDKITILKIKRSRIVDPDRLRNVEYEYRLLMDLRTAAMRGNHKLEVLQAALQAVNETIWQVEDDIREHERRQDFGSGFIALARAVYFNNDRRAAIKREINVWLNSAIIEEKSYSS